MRKFIHNIFLFITILSAVEVHAETVSVSSLKPIQQPTEIVSDKVLLYFWASWCPDCREKLSGPLRTLNQEFPKATILTINTDRDPEKGIAYAKQTGLNLAIYRDEEKVLTKQLKVFGVPAWAVLKKNKDEKFELVKATTGSDLNEIRNLLGEK